MNVDTISPLSLPVLLVNLALGLSLSAILSWYYVKYGKSLSNRTHFGAILPLLTMITLLVISVVKSSLALSLGLVGALSIVRFRTAIKDPEELIFLFFAIALGLGFGADQRIPTLATFVFILIFLLIKVLVDKKKKASHNLYLNIQLVSEEAGGNLFASINDLLLNELPDIDLRRLDHNDQQLQMTYYVNIHDEDIIIQIMDKLSQGYPESSISLVEQSNLLGG